jgi:methionine-rich copper-binding protein CopC
MTTLRHAGAVLFAVLVLATSAPAIFAHAALETSDPLDGGTIASPYVLVFRFDEELKSDGTSVTVRDSSGAIVAEGGLSADDAFTQVVELPAVPPGAYQAHWVSITADDNGKTQGDVNFTVVAATPPPAVTPTPATSPTYAPPSESAPPTSAATPSATPALTATPLASASPAPGDTGQPAGSELILPIVLVGAVVVGLAWYLLRRRPS